MSKPKRNRDKKPYEIAVDVIDMEAYIAYQSGNFIEIHVDDTDEMSDEEFMLLLSDDYNWFDCIEEIEVEEEDNDDNKTT